MNRKQVVMLVLALVLALAIALAASPIFASTSIGRTIWKQKCPADVSLIVTESEGGAKLVECILIY